MNDCDVPVLLWSNKEHGHVAVVSGALLCSITF